ncbi:septum site-determining protein Ssd [Actinophytocola xanthii]|uniref:septum site-determining protein Ssd n=1 Tax=Actinophytocola xanthii TaxID=1912961 RepID=UPI001E4FE662|nr:septum site-determining protein Ssd [Actinophytocola xanthii]
MEHEDLLDDVLKLAAAAGCDLECVPDIAATRSSWATATAVILDASTAAQCAQAALPRRDAVFLVSTDPAPRTLWERAVEIGAERVLELPGAEPWLVNALADATDAPALTTGRAVAVLGGRGGAGASVFAAALGLTAIRTGQHALLIDCDPLGGGLDLVLGAELEQGLRWPDMQLRAGRVAASSLHEALPTRTRGNARLTLLSGARQGASPAPDAVAAVLEAGRRAGETVICDLPRTLGPSAQAALTRADLTVVVVPARYGRAPRPVSSPITWPSWVSPPNSSSAAPPLAASPRPRSPEPPGSPSSPPCAPNPTSPKPSTAATSRPAPKALSPKPPAPPSPHWPPTPPAPSDPNEPRHDRPDQA